MSAAKDNEELNAKWRPLKVKISGYVLQFVVIILAACTTLAIYGLYNAWRERATEREFLAGIKDDLKHGASQIADSIKVFQPTLDYYESFSNQLYNNKIDSSYVDSLGWNLLNTNYFVFDDSRFEDFKSSGYLHLIENKQLMKHIVSLYSIYIPIERDADVHIFRNREEDFNKYIGTKLDFDQTGAIHLCRLLDDTAVRYQVFRYRNIFRERKRHQEAMISKIDSLQTEIERELN
jgi:hypothetical protein